MRCDYCPLGSDEDVCPETENEYGIEHKDGVLGCKHPRNWVEKRDNEYANYLGEMGLDMGMEMSLSKAEIDRVVEVCKHMIGLDHKRPYHRHQKAFYKPYRNYYCAAVNGEPNLDRLPDIIIKKIKDDKYVWYELTRLGLDWLGRQLQITIKGTGKE